MHPLQNAHATCPKVTDVYNQTLPLYGNVFVLTSTGTSTSIRQAYMAETGAIFPFLVMLTNLKYFYFKLDV
jgi:hypothetical protein